MGRHRKPKADRKAVDIRIPLTTAQKATVLQAAKARGTDTATWARPILLEAAQDVLRQSGGEGAGQK